MPPLSKNSNDRGSDRRESPAVSRTGTRCCAPNSEVTRSWPRWHCGRWHNDATPTELLRTLATLLAFTKIPDAKDFLEKFQPHSHGVEDDSRDAYVALVQLWAMLRDYGMTPETPRQLGVALGHANPSDVVRCAGKGQSRRRSSVGTKLS